MICTIICIKWYHHINKYNLILFFIAGVDILYNYCKKEYQNILKEIENEFNSKKNKTLVDKMRGEARELESLSNKLAKSQRVQIRNIESNIRYDLVIAFILVILLLVMMYIINKSVGILEKASFFRSLIF